VKERCSSKRQLTEADQGFERNLFGISGSRISPALTCEILGVHQTHVDHVATQYVGDQVIPWWASWRDPDGPSHDYALFSAPYCPENTDEERCHLIWDHEGGIHYFQ